MKRCKTIWRAVIAVLLIVTVFCAGVLIGVNYSENRVKRDINGKIDIYFMKEAEILNEIPEIDVSVDICEASPLEDYISKIKYDVNDSSLAVVYGTAKNIKMITLKDVVDNNDIVWYIVTFDIDVIDDLQTLSSGMETIHVVSAATYVNGCVEMVLETEIDKFLAELQTNKNGLFILRTPTAKSIFEIKNTWELKGKKYSMTDFADYFVETRFDCDGENFKYFYETAPLDALRLQKEE